MGIYDKVIIDRCLEHPLTPEGVVKFNIQKLINQKWVEIGTITVSLDKDKIERYEDFKELLADDIEHCIDRIYD